jgi:arylsulfatase
VVVHWPRGIKAKGEIHHQFAHIIDIASTVLEAAKSPPPKVLEGVEQMPLDGTAINYSFDQADAPQKHTVQYFERYAIRGIYADGWLAVTLHGGDPTTPWNMG